MAEGVGSQTGHSLDSPLFAVVVVGDNPDTVSSVGSLDGASWNNKWLHGVALTFQVSLRAGECHAGEMSNVFTNDPSWLCLLYDAKHARTEVAVILRSLLFAGDAERLAGEFPSE